VQIEAFATGDPVGKEGRGWRTHAFSAGKIVDRLCSIRLTLCLDGVYGYARRDYGSGGSGDIGRTYALVKCCGYTSDDAAMDHMSQRQ
jgi:hypothetical protein